MQGSHFKHSFTFTFTSNDSAGNREVVSKSIERLMHINMKAQIVCSSEQQLWYLSRMKRSVLSSSLCLTSERTSKQNSSPLRRPKRYGADGGKASARRYLIRMQQVRDAKAKLYKYLIYTASMISSLRYSIQRHSLKER